MAKTETVFTVVVCDVRHNEIYVLVHRSLKSAQGALYNWMAQRWSTWVETEHPMPETLESALEIFFGEPYDLTYEIMQCKVED
jgi:hypothetical protein